MELEPSHTQDGHHAVEDEKCSSRKRTDHHATRTTARRAQFDETDFGRNAVESRYHAIVASSTLVVYFREQRVRWMGNNSSSRHTINRA